MAIEALTPQERLAISRRALVVQLQGGDAPDDPDEPLPFRQASVRLDGTRASRFDWLSVARSIASRWWRRHPANAAGQLAMPLLERYARTEPAKLLAASAAVGALVVLVRPWRLLSITAVLAAILKTSDLADAVTTLMHKNTPPRKDPP